MNLLGFYVSDETIIVPVGQTFVRPEWPARESSRARVHSTESGEWKKSQRSAKAFSRGFAPTNPVSLFTDRNAKLRVIEEMGLGNTQNSDNCYKHDYDDTYRGTRASINFSEYTHVFDEPPKNHCIFRVDVYVVLRCTRNCVILYLGCIRKLYY